MVEPHLLVAVRFPPTREGSGTKGSFRRPKNRAFFQVSPSVFGTQLGIAVCIGMFWDFAVTSAIEVDEIVDAVRLIPQERVCQRTWSRLSMSPNHRSWSSSFPKNRPCASGVATPDTVHPDSLEDREGSTSAVP